MGYVGTFLSRLPAVLVLLGIVAYSGGYRNTALQGGSQPILAGALVLSGVVLWGGLAVAGD